MRSYDDNHVPVTDRGLPPFVSLHGGQSGSGDENMNLFYVKLVRGQQTALCSEHSLETQSAKTLLFGNLAPDKTWLGWLLFNFRSMRELSSSGSDVF